MLKISLAAFALTVWDLWLYSDERERWGWAKKYSKTKKIFAGVIIFLLLLIFNYFYVK